MTFFQAVGLAFKFIRYIPLLTKVLTDYQGILERVIKGKSHIPSVDDLKIALDDLKKLLESGLIDIPGVDEAKLVEEIDKLEKMLVAATTDALKNIARYGDPMTRALDGSVPAMASAFSPTRHEGGLSFHENPTAVESVIVDNNVTAPDPSRPADGESAPKQVAVDSSNGIPVIVPTPEKEGAVS